MSTIDDSFFDPGDHKSVQNQKPEENAQPVNETPEDVTQREEVRKESTDEAPGPGTGEAQAASAPSAKDDDEIEIPRFLPRGRVNPPSGSGKKK